MKKRLNFDTKEKMVALSGACFWYWNSFHSFLASSGVTPSVYNRYPKAAFSKYDKMRGILEKLEEQGNIQVINALISNFYRLRGAIDQDNLDNKKAKELLQEFRDSIGDDPIDAALKDLERARARASHKDAIEATRVKTCGLTELNERFLALTTGRHFTPQERGFEFESLFFDLLRHAEIEFTKPFRTSEGEQIDGHFRFEKFDYLVEAKWISGLTKQKDLSIFDGKIRGKAQSTRGLFLAAEGFDNNAVNKFSGDAPRIVLMTGQDLVIALNGTLPVFDILKAKIDAIVRFGNINFPACEIR